MLSVLQAIRRAGDPWDFRRSSQRTFESIGQEAEPALMPAPPGFAAIQAFELLASGGTQ
jgi:hypothetical protein